MRWRGFVWYAWGACLAAALVLRGAVPTSAAEQTGTNALRAARERMRARDFDAALALLGSGKSDPDLRPEAVRLEGTCWLGKALVAGNAFQPELARAMLVANTRIQFDRVRTSFPDDSFLRDTAPAIEQFVRGAEPLIRACPDRLRQCLESVRRARELADEALRLAPKGSAGHVPAAALATWTRLYACILVRDVRQVDDLLTGCVSLPKETLAAVRKAVAEMPQREDADRDLRAVVVPLVQEAVEGTDARLPTTLAEALGLYCAVTVRLDLPPFATLTRKYASLPSPEPPLPTGGWPAPRPVPEKPVALLTGPGVAGTLERTTQDLLLPLYLRAVELDPDGKVPAAHYGLYLVLLRWNEPAAAAHLEAWLRRHPRSPAFLLERARYAARQRHDLDAALADVAAAVRSGPMVRPIFLTFPEELHPDWLASRPVREAGATLALGYEPIFRIFDLKAAELPAANRQDRPEYVQLLEGRLAVAEVLAGASHFPDVLLGLQEGRSTLAWLGKTALPEARRAQLETTLRRIEESTARLPSMPAGVMVTQAGIRFADRTRPTGPTPSGPVGGSKSPFLLIPNQPGFIYSGPGTERKPP